MTSPGLLLALACVAAAASVALAVPGARPAAHDVRVARGRGAYARVPPLLAAASVCAAVVLGVPARRLALVVLLAAAGLVAARMAHSRGRRRAAEVVRARVLEVCDELAAELRAGRTSGEALRRAALEWAPLGPVAETDRLGGDVPSALRGLARTPGADDLVALAAAWHVAHRTGQGLGDALARVGRDLRARRSLRRVVDGELASARSTARLVAALPLLALAMGSGAGGDPWTFLLDSPVGLGCLAAGGALGALGLAWIEAIARDVDGPPTVAPGRSGRG